MRILADRTFDGDTFQREPVWIDVSGDRIASIRPYTGPESRPGSQVLDARGLLVMPGLINSHVHITRGGTFSPTEPLTVPQMVRNMQGTLAAGVTTVGEMGCTAGMADSLRRLVAKDPLSGPTVVASGPVVTAPKGYPLDFLPGWVAHMGAVQTCGTERDARAVAAKVARLGMDHLKIMIMHNSYAGDPLPVMGSEVARTLVEEAHTLGLRVYAHALSPADYRLALDAGVDALMHSSFEALDEETFARVKDSGVWVCPTLWVFESVCLGPEGCLHHSPRFRRAVPEWIRKDWDRFCQAYAASGDVVPEGITSGLSKERAKEGVRVAAANLMLLRDAGVRIAFGNDAAYGFCVHGRPVDELSAMHRAGLDTREVLKAATSGAAGLLGLADRGRLAPGQRADIICVSPRTEQDVAALEDVQHVVVAGRLLDRSARRLIKNAARTARATARGMLGSIFKR